jgi:hypothetical protein
MIFIRLTVKTAIAIRKDIRHTCADLPPLVSVEATGVFISTGNTETLLATVYKSPQGQWIDTDITGQLGFRNRSILAGDLNSKHTVWNSIFSNSQA